MTGREYLESVLGNMEYNNVQYKILVLDGYYALKYDLYLINQETQKTLPDEITTAYYEKDFHNTQKLARAKIRLMRKLKRYLPKSKVLKRLKDIANDYIY